MSISEMLGRMRGDMFGSGGAIPPIPLTQKMLEWCKEIHITDLQTFCLCRRQWDWSSTLRRGLQPAILPEPLFMGQGIHIALEEGYLPCLDSYGAEGGPMWFSGPTAINAFVNWVDSHKDKIDKYSGPLWKAQRSRIDDNIQMGIAMIEHYARWAKRIDKRFDLLGTEYMFKVPLPALQGSSRSHHGHVSHGYGHGHLAYAGRFDGLVRDRSNGYIYILEFKTAKSVSDQWLSGIFRSMQSTAYTWAARKVYHPQHVVGVLFRVMRKRVPDTPRLLKNGTFSVAKSQQLTEEWIDYCIDQWVEGGADREELERMSAGVKGMARGKTNDFLKQKIIVKPQTQIDQTLEALSLIGQQMADPHTPCPPMSGFHCGWCKFQDPCDLMNRGEVAAADAILEAEYAPRDYWEEADSEE